MKVHGATQNNLRVIRNSREISQMALRVTSGVSPNLISAIENHGLFPTDDVRERLAQALEVEQSDIWPHLAEPVGVR